jgi:hypothetical protein
MRSHPGLPDLPLVARTQNAEDHRAAHIRPLGWARRDRVAEIVAVAKKEHPYEVPGISTRTIADGNPDYLMWISQETAPD